MTAVFSSLGLIAVVLFCLHQSCAQQASPHDKSHSGVHSQRETFSTPTYRAHTSTLFADIIGNTCTLHPAHLTETKKPLWDDMSYVTTSPRDFPGDGFVPFPSDMATVEERFHHSVCDPDSGLTASFYDHSFAASQRADEADMNTLDADERFNTGSPQKKPTHVHLAPLPDHVTRDELDANRAEELMDEAPGALYEALERAEKAGNDLSFSADATSRSGTASYAETHSGVYEDD
eukprot:Opistho-2@6855